MLYQRLGRSGLISSRIQLGTMMFGGRTSETDSREIIDDAREHGVNVIDTADYYNGGASEEIVGRAIRGDRHHWILATKLGIPPRAVPNEGGLSRRWMMEATERSLRRLGVEHIDIQYLHREDPDTPLEETVLAMADLLRSGKVRYFGVSNHRAWRVARICALCDDIGIQRPVICQLYYHAFNRSAEVELLPACGGLGMGTAAYSPLARGVLTGKYLPDSPPPSDSRAASGDQRINQTEFHPANLAAAARLNRHCRERGLDMRAFALAWVLANPLMTGIVAGPRTLAQWQGYLSAADVTLDAQDEAFINDLVPAGTTAIPHYIDPAYPIQGRPVGAP